METDASVISRIYGTVMGRLGWRKLFQDYLHGYNDAFPSKSDAIRFIIIKYKNDQEKLIAFFQLLIGEHRGTTVENQILINEHLRPFGLAVNNDCVVYLVNRGNSFLTEIDNLLTEISNKTRLVDTINTSEVLKLQSHHLNLAQKHFNDRNWDDMSSQLRKALEYLISVIIKLKSQTAPESVNGQLKLLVEIELLTPNEKDLIYSMYGMLSDKGAHPGIAGLDESLLRYRITIEIARYIVKLV